MPANDLLHAVRLCDVNEGARQQLKELMCEVLREQGVGQRWWLISTIGSWTTRPGSRQSRGFAE